MAKEHLDKNLKITRTQMIQLLNEDLARKYQGIIAYAVNSPLQEGPAYTNIALALETHAREELAHATKIAKEIDYLGGTPQVLPGPVQTFDDPHTMLTADLENIREAVRRYHERILQAEAIGEFALSMTLHAIILEEQQQEIHLAAALGLAEPVSQTSARL